MATLRGFLSPWTLASVVLWLAILTGAYNWAIPTYAKVGDFGLCSSSPLCLDQEAYRPGTATFAIFAATTVTALVTGIVTIVMQRDRLARRLGLVLLLIGTAGVTIGVTNSIVPAAVFPSAVLNVCDVDNRDSCFVQAIYISSAAQWMAWLGVGAILAGFVTLRSLHLRSPRPIGAQVGGEGLEPPTPSV